MKEYSAEDLERMRIAMNGETPADKMKRKFKEEPFVPAGKRLFIKTNTNPHSPRCCLDLFCFGGCYCRFKNG